MLIFKKIQIVLSVKIYIVSLRGKEWAKVEHPNLELNDYKKNLENSSFVLCPWGNGFDTHRIWESLYSGSIPIIENHLTYQYLESLPCHLFIDNLVNLNEEYLKMTQ